MCENKDSLALTHPTVTLNSKYLTLSNMILSNVTRPFETGQCHILQHPHTFRHHLPTNDLPMYNHFSMHIAIFIQHLLNYILLHSISLSLFISRFILHVQTVSFMAHDSLRTDTLAHFFTLGLKQLSASKITHFSQYKLLPVARYGVCKKIIKGLS